jgi:two-component system sensor histidine kinase/response regulator
MKDNKPFVALIEDNPNTSRFLKERFIDRGIKVADFNSGEEFLQKGKNLQPDIYIIDYILNPRDPAYLQGADIIDHIKEDPKLINIPIIMLSTMPETGDVENNPYYQSKLEGLKKGAWDVIQKPHGMELLYKPELFPFEELLNKVQILLYNKLLQDELHLKNEELENKNQRLISVVHFLTHEIKNKLVVIEGLSRNVLSKNKKELPKKVSKFIKQIFFDTIDIRRLTEDYLFLFKQESGLSQINLQEINLIDTMNTILDRLSLFVESNDIELIRKGFDKIPPDTRINADSFLLSIVFENLFNNAVKYGKKKKMIICSVEERRGNIRFSVWNAGKGIPKKELHYLFDQFYRSEEVDQFSGTGIGLATVKDIIDRHGGKIWAESDYASWVNFIFYIPKTTNDPSEN